MAASQKERFDIIEWRKTMARIIYSGKIESDFEGFDDNAVFKMSNGTHWVQAQYKYWYHYAYRPEATITEENGRTILTVCGHSIPVRHLFDVIESHIEGTFKGWEGKTKYRLINGQEWQQVEYKYIYKYAYRPEVAICNIDGRYFMYVEGTHVSVKRV